MSTKSLRAVVTDGLRPKVTHAAQDTTLRVPRGTSFTLELNVVGENGAAFSLTGATVVLSVRLTTLQMSAPPGFDRTATLDASTRGRCTFAVTPADTVRMPPGRYVYDVWYTNGATKEQLLALSVFEVVGAAGR